MRDILPAFEAVKPTGQDKWQCRCPAHEDGTASLSITKTADKWLLFCHANCPYESILQSARLTAADMVRKDDYAPAILRDVEYKYTDASGVHVYSAIRKPLPDGRKKFVQKQANGEWSMAGVSRVLYNLPEVIKASVVFVVEGEKDVETLRSVGLVATTNVGGAGKFLQNYARYLEGKTVYIIPDNDEPGKQHAQDVRAILGHGTIIELPVGHKEDVTDWFKSGHGKDDLQKLIDDADKKPVQAKKTLEQLAFDYVTDLTDESLKLYTTGICELDDALNGGISQGERIVIAARPSHGKTAVALQLLHALSLQGLNCLFINEEMSEEMIGQRTVQFVSPITSQDAWVFNKEEIQFQVAGHFAERKQVFVESNSGTVQKVCEHIRNYHAKHGVQVVAIDYLQNLNFDGAASGYEKVSQVSKMLSAVTKELGITAIMLCQLNREIEQRRDRQDIKPVTGKKKPLQLPKMSDIKESGQIEQDADIVMFCVWPKMFDPSTDPSEYVFSVGKNRNRGIGKSIVYCEFNPDRQRVRDVPVESNKRYNDEFDNYN